MRYTAAYRIPDHDDLGHNDRSSYMIINSAGYYEFDEPFGYTHRKHGRKDYYLSYNHGSPMKLRALNREHIIGEGTVFMYHPFEEQFYGHADKNVPISNYWVHFTGYGVSELLLKANLTEDRIFLTGTNEEIPLLFEKLIYEITEKRPGYELLTASLLIQIISLVSRQVDISASGGISEQNRRIQEAMEYIHRNYNRQITVSELAAIANLSVSRFSGIFQQKTGAPPLQYIIRFKLQKACELMRHTSFNIRQVSVLAGFEDQLYFSRLFKKYMGLSPSEYIQGLQQKQK